MYNRKVYNGLNNDAYDRPKAPVHVLVGSAGCPEKIDPFIANPKPWSAKRISNYGITEMSILNKTHIRFRQRDTTSVIFEPYDMNLLFLLLNLFFVIFRMELWLMHSI